MFANMLRSPVFRSVLLAAASVIALSGCGGGGGGSSSGGASMVMQQPQEQSRTFEAACEGDRCAATFGDLTLNAGRIGEDGSYTFAGTAFEGAVELPQGGSATYEGPAAFSRSALAGTDNGGDEHGKVTLTADFGAKTIGGRVAGTNGSPVRLILNPASPASGGDFRTFEAFSVECRAGVSCDAGEWTGRFGRGNTVGVAFSASLDGREVVTGAGIAGGQGPESPSEPEAAIEWPDWPIPNLTAARINTGNLEIEAMSSDAIRNAVRPFFGPITSTHSANYRGFGDGLFYWWLSDNVEFKTVGRGPGSIPLFMVRSGSRIPDANNMPPNFVSVGGWMEYGAFLLELARPGFGGFTGPVGHRVTYYDYPSGVNFAENMHWHGVMLGTDKRVSANPNLVQGTVYITVRDEREFYSTVEVDFKNIVDVNTGTPYPAMEWQDVPLNQGGGFIGSQKLSNGNEGGRLTLFGHITGPRGEEIAGFFDDSTLTGVFGAKRHICSNDPCQH